MPLDRTGEHEKTGSISSAGTHAGEVQLQRGIRLAENAPWKPRSDGRVAERFKALVLKFVTGNSCQFYFVPIDHILLGLFTAKSPRTYYLTLSRFRQFGSKLGSKSPTQFLLSPLRCAKHRAFSYPRNETRRRL